MLYLVIQLGADRYAIDAAQVVEVLPLVNSKHLPGAPVGVAGVFDYHGEPVPLIDLAELVQRRPSRKWMNSRIILVNYRDKSGNARLLGLLAEHATETMYRPEEDFIDMGVTLAGIPCLGSAVTDAAGMVQRIGIQSLLSESVGDQLFREHVESL